MITLKSSDEIEYGIPEAADLPLMANLLAEEFSLYDPPAVAVGLPFEEIKRLVEAFGPRALQEQISIVARFPGGGDLVGAVLVGDFATPPPEGIDALAPAFAPIGAMLDALDNGYRAQREIVAGSFLHIFMVGVARHANGRGIAGQLVTTCLENGKSRGYAAAVTEATGSISQHIFRKHGFRDVSITRYNDFVFDGRRIFSTIAEPEGTILMDKDL